jgi:5'-3' exonuclease
MLRYNQQKNLYDVIDIDQLSSNFYSYICDKIKDKKIVQDCVINDIVFIITLFGNDFLPKIETFNIKYDLEKIIDIYSKLLKYDQNYLILYDKHKRKINNSFLIKLIKKFSECEDKHLYNTYLSNHYRNYDKIKKIIHKKNSFFVDDLTHFLEQLNNFVNDVKNDNNIDIWINNTEFSKQLEQLSNISISSYIDQNKNNKSAPLIKIKFQDFTRSFDLFQQQKLTQKLKVFRKNSKVLKYDIVLYKFDNVLDEFQHRFGMFPIDIGKTYIDNKTMLLKTENINDSIATFYKSFFNIDNMSINDTKMNHVLNNYVEGLHWVFEYYFNNYDEQYHTDFANIWFYQYTHAPLFSQIYQFMNNTNIQYNFDNYIIKRNEYFNCDEHLMYVTPKQVLIKIAPTYFKKVINTDLKDHYIDLDFIVDKFMKNQNLRKYIDCRGAIYLTKCHLYDKINTFDYDTKFIKILRKINKQTDYHKINNKHVVVYNKYITLDTLK